MLLLGKSVIHCRDECKDNTSSLLKDMGMRCGTVVVEFNVFIDEAYKEGFFRSRRRGVTGKVFCLDGFLSI